MLEAGWTWLAWPFFFWRRAEGAALGAGPVGISGAILPSSGTVPLRSHEPWAVACLGVKSSPRRDTRGPRSQGAWPFWQALHTGPLMTSSEASGPLGRRGKSQPAVACHCPPPPPPRPPLWWGFGAGGPEREVCKGRGLGRGCSASTGVGEHRGQACLRQTPEAAEPPARWHCSCPVCVRHWRFGPRRCWGGGRGGGSGRVVGVLGGAEKGAAAAAPPPTLARPRAGLTLLGSAPGSNRRHHLPRHPPPPPPRTASPSKPLDTEWPGSTPDPQNRTQGHQGGPHPQ